MRGIVLGQEGVDTALVRLASASDMQQLRRGSGVLLHRETAPDRPTPYDVMAGEFYLQTEDGRMMRVGRAVSCSVSCEAIDTTSFQDRAENFMAGRIHMDIRLVDV